MGQTILVFDSGAGGLSIVRALVAANGGYQIAYGADSDFFPYGDKSDAALLARIPALCAAMVARARADVLVVACNTASTLTLDQIRAQVSVPVVGVVPAIKPAALATKTGTIGLLATPRTIARAYTDALIGTYAGDVRVLRHGPPDLALAAEQFLAHDALDLDVMASAIDGLLRQDGADAMDIIVLACTHYPLVAEGLYAALAQRGRNDIALMDSAAAIVRRVHALCPTAAPDTACTLAAFQTTGGDTATITTIAQRFGFGPSLVTAAA